MSASRLARASEAEEAACIDCAIFAKTSKVVWAAAVAVSTLLPAGGKTRPLFLDDHRVPGGYSAVSHRLVGETFPASPRSGLGDSRGPGYFHLVPDGRKAVSHSSVVLPEDLLLLLRGVAVPWMGVDSETPAAASSPEQESAVSPCLTFTCEGEDIAANRSGCTPGWAAKPESPVTSSVPAG